MKMYQYDGEKLLPCEKICGFIKSWEPYYWIPEEKEKWKAKNRITVKVWDGKKSITEEKSVWVNATCKLVETNQGEDKTFRNIETILKEGIQDTLDVEEILAWKIGKINMLETQDMLETQKKKELVFDKSATNPNGWERSTDSVKLKNKGKVSGGYGGKINLQEICKDIVDEAKKIGDIKNYQSDEVIKFVNHYEQNKGKEGIYYGVGLVYLITLLHFMTRGGVPIYDRFVHIALKALYRGIEPGSCVYYAAPDAADYKTYLALMDEYTWLMKETIENKGRYLYRKNDDEKIEIEAIRKMDRALWVYGHLFNL